MSAHKHHRATYRPWTPRTGDRVTVKNGPHRGEHGTVTDRQHGGRPVVQLDAHEIPRVFFPRDLERLPA